MRSPISPRNNPVNLIRNRIVEIENDYITFCFIFQSRTFMFINNTAYCQNEKKRKKEKITLAKWNAGTNLFIFRKIENTVDTCTFPLHYYILSIYVETANDFFFHKTPIYTQNFQSLSELSFVPLMYNTNDMLNTNCDIYRPIGLLVVTKAV